MSVSENGVGVSGQAPVAPGRAGRGGISRRRVAGGIGATLGLTTLGAGWRRASAQASTPAAGATRLIVDPSGRQVEVPAAPRRVVALDPNRTIVNLVEIGLVPVGATTNDTNPDGGFSPTIADVAGEIERVGVIGSASLEAVAALDPDLIFYATAYQDIPLDRLQAIAPTVAYEAPAASVAEHLAFVGEAVGRPDAARRVTDEFAATVAAHRATLGLDGRRVGACGFVNYESAATFWIAGPENVFGTLLVDLGARLVPATIDGQPVTDFVYDLSLEVVGEFLAEAEVVVATRYFGADETQANFERVVASPLWAKVPAVERGDVAILDVQPVFGNWGVRGLELGLADLAARL